MKIGCNLKKAISGLLVVALIIGSVQWGQGGTTVLAQNIDFDENNVVLRVGVLSDIHLAYGTSDMNSIKSTTKKYVNNILTLNEYSGNEMDVLLLGGDYGGYGIYEQARTFATATKVAMDEINKEKQEGNKTQLLLTYGNHDTDWNGQLTYTEWEKLFDEEGLKLLDGVTRVHDTEGNENVDGCYSYVYTDPNGVEHYFLSLETESYDSPSNTFTVDALKWLDEELSKIESANKDNQYVYIVSHAPIKESGVYGSDLAYDPNADWATAEGGAIGAEKNYTRTVKVSGNSDEIKEQKTLKVTGDVHSVLAKYPNVVYMSGHTHLTGRVESTIMAKDYTAINIPFAVGERLYSSESKYLDGYKNGQYGITVDGVTQTVCGLYIEVDNTGKQRITRVDLTNSNVISVEVVGEEKHDVAENPMINTNWEYTSNPMVEAFYSTGVNVTRNQEGSVKTIGEKWVMDAPKGDGDTSHLIPYTAAARNEEAGMPVFKDGAKVTVSNIKSTDQLAFDFTFPTAKVANGHHIMRYDLTVKDQDGKVIATEWILGDWLNNTEGCATDYNHQTAEELSYTKVISRDAVQGVTGFSVSITAWNEFGGNTTISTEGVQQVDVVTKPPIGAYYENLFDGLTLDDVVINSNGEYSEVYSEQIDEKGNVAVSYNTWDKVPGNTCKQYHDELIYILNDNYTSSNFSGWGKVGTHASKAVSLDPNDTFAYATDFNITEGAVNFTFRALEATSSTAWVMDYSGVKITSSGVKLVLANQTLKDAKGNEYKVSSDYTDGKTHTLSLISTPTHVTVWIDDDIIFDNVEYDVSKLCDGTGTSEDPYVYGDATLKGTTMYPVIAVYVEDRSEFTLNNQFLHIYNQNDDLSGELRATDKNYYDASKLTGADATTLNGFTVNEINLGEERPVYFDMGTEFKATDKVVMEFDITPGDFTPGTSDASTKIIGFAVKYRKDSALSSANCATLTERYLQGGAFQEIYNHFEDNYMVLNSANKGKFVPNTTYHYKFITDNEKVSIWVNDVPIVVDARYDATNNKTSNPNVNSNTMVPALDFVFTSASWEVERIKIYKADGTGTIDKVTQLTQENNLMIQHGTLASSFMGNSSWSGKSDSTVNGTNFYTDLTYMNLKENGATDYDVTESVTLFGKSNSNYTIASNESFVMSALVRVSNAQLKAEETSMNNRVGAEFAVYDKIKAWYYIDSSTSNGNETTKLHVFHTDDYGTNAEVGTVNLSELMGYERSDYNRITNVVSPFGYEIYINGYKVFEKEVGNGTNVNYSNMKFTASGVEATFVDVSVCYNQGSAEMYEDRIHEAIHNYEQTMQGIYGDNKAYYDAQVSDMKLNYKAASEDYDTLKTYVSYVGTIEEYKNELRTTGRVVNNHVQQEVKTVYKDVYVNATNGNKWDNKHIRLFESGECPFDETSKWVIEADISTQEVVSNQSLRIGLSLLGDAEGPIFVQDNNRFYRIAGATDFTSASNTSGATGATIRQVGTWHVKYTIIEDERIQMTLTTQDGKTILHDFTVDLKTAGYDFTGKDLYPRLYFANGKFDVSDIKVYMLENAEGMQTVITPEIVFNATSSTASWYQKKLCIYGDENLAPDMQDGDVWVYEADLKASGTVSRICFALSETAEGNMFIQGKDLFRVTGASNYNNYSKSLVSFAAGNWHLKYTITWGTNLVAKLTNEAEETIVCEIPWGEIVDLPADGTKFNPYIHFVNTVAEFSNVYVGHDLTSNIAKLNEANTNATAKTKEENVTNVSIQKIELAQHEVAPVIATTAAYTKAEIKAATDKLNNVINNAKKGNPIQISDRNTGTATLVVAENEEVYKGYLDAEYNDSNILGQIYIVKWTDAEGKEVDAWTEGVKPEIIDTKMLNIKYQGEYAKDSKSKYRVRFLSSVNALEDYTRAGIVFSLKDTVQNPDVNTGIVRDTTTVYKSVIAGGQKVTVEQTYDEYSSHMYGRIINNIPEGYTIYVRGFVELTDGTIVYGVTRPITVTSSMLSVAEQ